MKKILIITAALTLGFFIKINAQEQRGNPPSKEEMLKRTMTGLTKEVELTEKEKTSVEEIFTDFFTKMEEMRKEGERPDRSKMEPLVKSRDEKVKAVLSEEKFKAYSKFMESHMRGPQGNQPPEN